jgi:DNA polymerase I-like protein with 3'-5' exonuclease and polymerase domains|tara:strand:- start:4728 stop:6707 length:1980 start_codon:yes stop_codon:yes gene_type:complete
MTNLFGSDLHHEFKGELDMIDKDWNIPTEFPDLTGYKDVAVDLETKDPNIQTLGPGWARKDGHIIGIAVAAGEYKGYFPIRHANGHNLDAKIAMRWLAKQMSVPDMNVIMHNATYDAGWMRAEGVEIKGRIIDTMITGALVDENRWSFGLDAMARDYASIRKDEKMLKAAAKAWGINPKAEMWQLPPMYVGAYAERDAVATLALWTALKIELEEQELWHIWNIETDLIPCMLDMRTNGVRVDLEKAQKNKKFIRDKSKEMRRLIEKEAGMEVDIWASASIQKMFDKMGMSYPRTPTKTRIDVTELPDGSSEETEVVTGGNAPSFTKAWLNSHPSEICQQLVKLREFDKADSTFIDSILRHEHNGRIHTELHSTRRDEGGTVTGRFSSSNPNLQQIPARDKDIKKLIRGLFIPEDGYKWGSFDYSSQEPRLLVHFAASVGSMPRKDLLDDIVHEYNTSDVDLHQMVADLAGISRKEAKAVNLGIMYGMGVGKLANQIDVEPEDAKILMTQHRNKVPFVKALAEMASQRAASTGQIRTLLGRKCRFHLWEPAKFGAGKPLPYEEALKEYGGVNGTGIRRAFTYKALNRLIQGSAADQTKKAMLDCYQAGHTPMLTVHDELCFNIDSTEQADHIKELMETGVELKVPSKIDVDIQKDWGDIE